MQKPPQMTITCNIKKVYYLLIHVFILELGPDFYIYKSPLRKRGNETLIGV